MLRMEENKIINKIKVEGKSLLNAIGSANETAYLVLFSMYVTLYFWLDIAWLRKYDDLASGVRYILLGIVMWGCAVYLFFIIAAWKNLWDRTVLLIVIGGAILACTHVFSRNMSTNLYGAVMDCFFCIAAYKKDYRKILKCTMGVSAALLVVAAVGMPLGVTANVIKPENVHPGNSLGIVYPNTWGHLVFLVLMIFWYLYLRSKPVITALLFWAISAFMMFYIYCRTVAIIMIAFPFFALIVYFIEKKVGEKSYEDNRQMGILGWFIVSIPVISFAFMLILSLQVEWLHSHFYYTWFHNFAMRFVQGGLYFRTYGFPLIGNPYKGNVTNFINVNGDFLEVGILDSSFAAYLIMRGLLWICGVMLWLCLGHYKAFKKRDYAILFLSLILLGFAMLERPGLEAWYNFVLLYPLAKAAQKNGLNIESNDSADLASQDG